MLHPQQNALQIKDLREALKVLGEDVDGTGSSIWRFRHQSELPGAEATVGKPPIRDERAVFCCV